MDHLADRVALVTGGSRGIGREIAIALAEAGAHVAIGYRQGREAAAAVAAEIVARGRKSIALSADLGDADAAAGLVRAATEALGTIDILVNNAGINPSKPLAQITSADWDETIRVNLSSVFYVTQAALPAMRAQGFGRIIILSSVAAQLGGVIGPHYAASKAGLIGLMHGYASQLAQEGITANAIAPALIETDMLKGNDAITPDKIPLGRFGQPDEVSSVAVMLAGNGYVTGQTINVNGGWYMS
ncbi:SDR family NAD(P)-dependent oxidoreductase [Sphingomonas abietis]|uniref:SDR family NAD(P)-dependent oxidoreductase n=1 Tax=Sphingomonas abietis TaxID=3012344 RepID=A0ABY7NGT1_9SPHN|nr:SDR family NAD(P)-dependent oxidoreductase [Sphingomonas abietis]WBO20755.1 SDR family NAD(P)-dependent oxidoreductase [Sphingomonas abietis]